MTSPAGRAGYRRMLTVLRWPVGGIRTYLIDNYRALSDAGYHFTFVGPADETFRRFRNDLRDWPNVESVEAPIVGRNCRLRSTVRELLRTRRFCVVHSQGLTAGASVVLANRGLHVPHIITSHDVIRSDQFPGPIGHLKRWALAQLLRRATALVAVSHDATAEPSRLPPRAGPGEMPLADNRQRHRHGATFQQRPSFAASTAQTS